MKKKLTKEKIKINKQNCLIDTVELLEYKKTKRQLSNVNIDAI